MKEERKREKEREIGQSHRLGANNRGTRRRVMTAGITSPLVGRNSTGDMYRSNDTTPASSPASSISTDRHSSLQGDERCHPRGAYSRAYGNSSNCEITSFREQCTRNLVSGSPALLACIIKP